MTGNLYFYNGATLVSTTINITFSIPQNYACRTLSPGVPGSSGNSASDVWTWPGASLYTVPAGGVLPAGDRIQPMINPPYLVDNLDALGAFFTYGVDSFTGIWAITAKMDLNLTVSGYLTSDGVDGYSPSSAATSIWLGVTDNPAPTTTPILQYTTVFTNGGAAGATFTINPTVLPVKKGTTLYLISGIAPNVSDYWFSFYHYGNWKLVVSPYAAVTPPAPTGVSVGEVDGTATSDGGSGTATFTAYGTNANVFNWYSSGGTFLASGSTYSWTATPPVISHFEGVDTYGPISETVYCQVGNSNGSSITWVTSSTITGTVNPYVPTCFLAGTKVTMADGTDKNIEEIKPGDSVYSYDEVSQEYNVGRVNSVETQASVCYYKVSLNNDTFIEITKEHPISTTHGWASIDPKGTITSGAIVDGGVSQLCVGDSVLLITGTTAKLIGMEEIKGGVTTYNLDDITNFHTFFANGVLVHNSCCCFPAGTMITMSDGSLKKIEDVQIGDQVLCYDENLGRQTSGEVKALRTPARDHICTLTFDTMEALRITSDHPVLTTTGWKSVDPEATRTGGGYKKIDCGKLAIGDQVLTASEGLTTVTSIETSEVLIQTYTLDVVSTYANFYAGGILSHNCCCFPAGSMVLMADYSWKAIETVQIGEEVMGIDGKPNTVFDMEFPLLGDRTYLRFEDNSLFTSASHCIWGRGESGDWWVTRGLKELRQEAIWGKGADMLRIPYDNSDLKPFQYAHLDGFKHLNTVKVPDQSPYTQLYQVRCDRSKCYIVNGYVVGSVPDDRTFDYASVNWDEVRKSLPTLSLV